MSVIETSLFHIVKRFPEKKDAIRHFFMKNGDFHIMCDDYRRCAEALQRWNQSASAEAPERRKEYFDLLRELELEIIQYLNQRA